MPKWDMPPEGDPGESFEQDSRLDTVGEPKPFSDYCRNGSPLDPEAVIALANASSMEPATLTGVLLDPRTLLYQSKVPGYKVIHIPAEVLGVDEPVDVAIPAEHFPQ